LFLYRKQGIKTFCSRLHRSTRANKRAESYLCYPVNDTCIPNM